MSRQLKVLSLGGDGIGPEVINAGLEVLRAIARREGLPIVIEEDLLGGASWDVHGTFCTDELVDKAKAADAVLVGSVGGPKWDDLDIQGDPAQKDGLVRLRQELDVYAGLRPAKVWPPLIERTPFKPDLIQGSDVMVLRELCGGIYFGKPRGIEDIGNGVVAGFDANYYTDKEIERIAHVGFELARRRRGLLTSVDKANVMESGVLWRRLVQAIGENGYPDVRLNHLYADNALYQLTCNPLEFDVIVCDNLFGDLISDMAGALAGSLGMLPSASLCGLAPEGSRNTAGIFEPVHGTAPDIAGQGVANPLGAILSIAMMMEYAFARPDLGANIEQAVKEVLDQNMRTADLGGQTSTADMSAAVVRAIESA